MKKILPIAFVAALGLQANAQSYVPVTLTGFTADVIANGTGPAAGSTTHDVDGEDYNFVAQGFVNPSGQSPTTFLPASGLINSAVTATPGLTFQLQPYTGNNSLRLTTAANTGTLTFSTPRNADQVYLLTTTAYTGTFTATVNFTDGTNQAITSNVLPNWFDGTAPVAIQGISRVLRSTSAIENLTTNPRMYQVTLTLNAANIPKLIQSITITKTSTGAKEILHIFGVSVRTVLTNDVAVTGIVGLTGQCGMSNQEDVCVTIKNNGSATQTSFPVSYTINGGAVVTETFTGSLAAGATTNFCFAAKANLSVAGTYAIQACTGLANDQLSTNNCNTKTVTSIPTISTFPYIQNFEANDGGWVAGGTSSSWAWGAPAKAVINSAASGTKAWVTGLTANYNSNEKSQVVGPCFNFSTLVAPVFEMKAWWNSEFSWDGAVLQSSIDGGTTWQVVGAKGDPNNWYNDNTINGAPGGQPAASAQGWSGRNSTNNGSGGWVTVKHALTGLGGKTSVKLRIAFGADASVMDEGFAFDDVMIYDTPATDGGVTAITSPNSGCSLTSQETITITVKNYGSAALSNIPVSYTINGGTPVNDVIPGPIAPNTTANFSFATKANLSVVGTYTIVTKTNLTGDGLAVNDATSKIVTSIPSISTLPYTEGFENGPGGWSTGGANSSWALGTPAKNIINSAAAGTKAWVTSLTGNYNASEKSYVLGPCFNLAGKPDPDFEMKVWWNSQFSFDGTVLQSSIDGGTTWQNVGAKGDPNNWYNDNTINGGPGEQPAASAQGWSGTTAAGNGSNGWKTVKHRLAGLGGKSSVQLRIAFASDATTQDNGFAFDEVRIGDNTNNMAVNSIVPINKLCGFTTSEQITAVLENAGPTPLTGFTVSYSINGGTPVTETYSGTLAGGATTNFTFAQGANLAASGSYTITVTVNMTGDPDAANNTATYTIANSSFSGLPPVFDFEPGGNGLAQLRTVTKPKSAIVEDAGASNGTGTKGLVMDGVSSASWTLPAGIVDPWTNNLDNFSVAYICFNPSGGNPNDPLWLSFDLKQLFKVANANTNFRVTVNGVQVGPTYRPPFSGTPINWQRVNLDLSAYKNQTGLQIGLESNVKEAYAAGAGTANLIDNITISRMLPTGIKADLLQSQLHIFPNPSNGQFNLDLPKSKNYQLEVTDLSGKVILQKQVNGEAQLNLENTAKGIYLLKVSGENGTAVRKLVLE